MRYLTWIAGEGVLTRSHAPAWECTPKLSPSNHTFPPTPLNLSTNAAIVSRLNLPMAGFIRADPFNPLRLL